MVVVLVTSPSMELAKEIAKTLIQEEKAACVNIVPKVLSIYKWQGELFEEDEVLLFIKTTSLKKVKERILELHSYEVPEIVALEVKEGHKDYISWVKESVKEEPPFNI
ncbi:MAG: divalent-cation tolerance protein CutA [Epsilonproteobacteria bacterium]|nr:divalent-cation tolerance protein CutA [Campylobacterota bacterium]